MYKIQEKDVTRAARVLADAFQYEPIWKVILEGKTLEQSAAWFSSPVRYCMAYNGAYAPSSDIEGFIGYLPSEYADMTFGRMLKARTMRGTRKAGLQPMFRMAPLAILGKHRKEHMAGRKHIYVIILGVAHEHHRKGFGSKLIRHVIDESEKSSLPIYLETSTDENVAFYKSLGFSVIDKITIPKMNLPQYELIREPSEAGNFIES